jgi:integrase/recombinase XerD
MLDDMRMRKLDPKTQSSYVRAVRRLARFLERSPDGASVEDLRRFQLHLVDTGTSPMTINATLTGLKFFCEITLDRPELLARVQPVRVPRTLPVVLSPSEVARLLAAVTNLKHQTALSIAYGAGLRVSEVTALKVGDVDSQRMTLRVEQGKGRKDRYAMLSPGAAAAHASVVACGPCTRQDPARRLALSGARPDGPDHVQAVEPGRPCCG